MDAKQRVNSQGGTVTYTEAGDVASGGGPALSLVSTEQQPVVAGVVTSSVPIPKKGSRGSGSKYPFMKMRVGDSFWWPVAQPTLLKTASREHAKRHNLDRDYTCRTESQDGQKGARIWRVR